MTDGAYRRVDIHKYLKATDYPDKPREAITEMHRQVGDLILDENGIGLRGILLRHLVMPGGVAGARDIMRFIAKEISPNTYVNIMDQYRPCGNANKYPSLDRSITHDEYEEALRAAATGSKERGAAVPKRWQEGDHSPVRQDC